MKDFVMDGYVCKGVEVRSTQAGKLVTKFTLNSPDYNRSTQQSEPAFFRCEYWHNGQNDPKAANIVEGAVLLVWGSMRFDQYTDKAGNKRSETAFKVREIGLIKPPARPQQPQYAPQPTQQAYAPQYAPQPAPAPVQQPAAAYQQPAPVAVPPQAVQVPMSVYDEDIPF
ncbi:single-stranded DNA-binding protein [Eggerthella lenta]|uniref:Single-stranded DNA-binding protein n=1 Tax=Eggerthella lenta (strain ATCC 25559 / DSM 2243 / CCUG 17323 / JCM 9979 / KCTC 3265 / NCTC 11813 / VPI 0255 / 1899 B) TaxID=479437 RepID=C8WLU3_EGGLE|nr:single-stranded DNA-binding protein [Eggerthella lenta]ACV56556.1 single-strand binding protein [Eggerthella lenta DSM 2243]